MGHEPTKKTTWPSMKNANLLRKDLKVKEKKKREMNSLQDT